MNKLLSCLFVFVSLSASMYANEMIDVINTFRADKFALRRTYTMRESKEYYERYNRFYANWETKLNNIDFNELSKDGKADYILLKNLIGKEEYLLNQDYDAFKEVASVVDFADDLYAFIQQRRRGTQPDAKTLAMAFNDAEKSISEKSA